MTNRRSFLRGLIAAPAIVAYGNIMPVRLFEPPLLLPDGLVNSFAQTKEIYAANLLNMEAWRNLLLPGLLDAVQQYSVPPDFRHLFEDNGALT